MHFSLPYRSDILELAAILASLLILLAYQWYLRRCERATPMKMARSAHAVIRGSWVKAVMERSGTEILVIQTLRNSLMAASFMASTAVLALSAMINWTLVTATENSLPDPGSAASLRPLLVNVKLVLLASTYGMSFLFNAMAARFFNHAGYLITAIAASEELSSREVLVTAYLNRAGHHYSLGLRLFFVSLPFLASLFNGYLILPVTVFLVFIFYHFDRIPGAEG